MKALFVVHNLTLGGIQTQALALAKHLKSKHGFDVEFYSVGASDNNYTSLLDKEGFSYRKSDTLAYVFTEQFYQLNIIKRVLYLLKLRRELAKGKYDVVFPYAASKAVNFIYKLSGIKVSFWFERCGHDNPKPLYIDFYQQIIRKNNPVMVANSEHGAKALAIIHHKNNDEINVIRNKYIKDEGVYAEEAWSKTLNKSDNELYFVMIANFFFYKDQETVIRAWSQLDNNIERKLIFAGLGGPDACKSKYSAMKSLVSELDLDKQVLFLGAVKDTSKLLSLADVGILSTQMEGCPNAVLEYMAAKLPVIATKIEGNKEVLPILSHDYLFECGDVNHCCQLLNKLSLDHELRSLLAFENETKLLDTFDGNLMYEKYDNLLLKHNII